VLAHSLSTDLLPGTYTSSDYSPSSLDTRNLTTTSTYDTFTLNLPSTPVIFSSKNYHDPTSGDWSSAVFPDGWYGLISPGLAVWGGIPVRGELRNIPPKSREFMEVAYGELKSTDRADGRSL